MRPALRLRSAFSVPPARLLTDSLLAGTSENALQLTWEQGRSLFGRPKTLGAENGKGETDVHVT